MWSKRVSDWVFIRFGYDVTMKKAAFFEILFSDCTYFLKKIVTFFFAHNLIFKNASFLKRLNFLKKLTFGTYEKT